MTNPDPKQIPGMLIFNGQTLPVDPTKPLLTIESLLTDDGHIGTKMTMNGIAPTLAFALVASNLLAIINRVPDFDALCQEYGLTERLQDLMEVAKFAYHLYLNHNIGDG